MSETYVIIVKENSLLEKRKMLNLNHNLKIPKFRDTSR